MSRAFLATVLLLAVAAGPRAEAEHGSLVIAMPVTSGWVVCGDKRRTSTVFAATEDEIKVFELTKGVVAGMTGLRRVNEHGTPIFDVAESVKAFASARPFDGRDDYAESLGKALGADFLRSVPPDRWPEVRALEDRASSAFAVMLFWATRAGLPQWAEVTFSLRGGPGYKARSTRDVVATSNRLRPITSGNLAVVDELQHGRLPAFDEARRDADIRRFLIAPYAWRERTAAEAEFFGRRLVELTSARLPELQPKGSDVGPAADCLSVSAAAG